MPLTQRPRACWASSRTTPSARSRSESAIPQSRNTSKVLSPIAGGGVGVGGTVLLNRGAPAAADVIALATGFKVLQFLWPMDIIGKSGKTLREQWGVDDARAYLAATVPDFPNFFIVNGPNTNAGHGGSAIHATEFQVRYIMQAIRHLLVTGTAALEVDRDAFYRYNAELDEALSHCIWSHKGMTTYYRNDAGRIVVSSPWKYRLLAADP